MMPQRHHNVVNAITVRTGALNPFDIAQGVINLLTPYPQTFLFLYRHYVSIKLAYEGAELLHETYTVIVTNIDPVTGL